MVAELAPTKTKAFKLVGVTWDTFDNDEQVKVEVRVRNDDGWTAWEPLEVDEDGGEAKRGGTEPWWTDSADQVSARVTTASGATPTGVKVVTVDPAAGDTPAGTVAPAFYSTSQQSSVVAAADGTPGFTPQPPIIMRAAWGAKAADRLWRGRLQGLWHHHARREPASHRRLQLLLQVAVGIDRPRHPERST